MHDREQIDELPTIKSLGLPPEKHADRVVREMLKVLTAAHQWCWSAILAVIEQSNDGNPAAQRKMLERIKEAAQAFYLGAHIKTGKRGRYVLTIATMNAWNAETKAIVFPDDPMPETPWLAFSTTTITSKGKHRYDDEVCELYLFVTHHALSRLAQRCGARTIDDVAQAARRIGVTFLKTGRQTIDKILRDDGRMKVELPREMGTAVCPLKKYDDEYDGSLVITTLWKEDEEEA